MRNKNLEQQRSDHKYRRHKMTVHACNKLRDVPHGGDVGGDIESIGEQQQ